ncbi:MAG: NAD/NADP octopine/nopaline dehydrogenase family protein [Nakamurella sp.]
MSTPSAPSTRSTPGDRSAVQLPDKAVVLGSGAGALTTAVELSGHGVAVTVADLPQFSAGIVAIAAAGAVRMQCQWHGDQVAPIAGTSTNPAAAIKGHQLIVVSVPSFGHKPFAELLAGALTDGQQVLWVGEGGGALSLATALRRSGRRPAVEIAETNSLPYGARVKGPALVSASRKSGGTVVAGLPPRSPLVGIANRIWPWVTPAQNVWETVLLNFNAIDHVPPIVCNLGTIEGRTSSMLLWGEGATPAVARVIEGIDNELLAIRAALGITNDVGYAQYLVQQGFAAEYKGSLYATLAASAFASSVFPCGPEALKTRFITEDVPYAQVLMSSLGAELAVPTPTIDAMITLASIAAHTDFRAQGRTLADFDLAGVGRDGLLAAANDGWW